MRKTRHLVIVIAVVAIVLGIGAVSAYASLADDTTPPVTTSNAVANYWNDATINLSAADGDGVAYIYHELDGGVVRLYTVGAGPAEVSAPTNWKGEHQSLSPGTHTLRYWAQDVNGNVEMANTVTFTVKTDTAAPVTTATGATDGKWYKAALALNLTAVEPADASGVKSIAYTLDGTPASVEAATVDVSIAVDTTTHANDGDHTLTYQATDVAGNVETLKTLTVHVDTVKPAPKAPYAATAYRGRTAILRYKVVDALPNGGTASGKIVVKNKAGKVVKTILYKGKAVNTALTAKFAVPRTWRAGTYKFRVYATDTAGNAQVKVVLNKLVIK